VVVVFAETAVSREGFRGYFAPKATKAKQSSNNFYVDNLLQSLNLPVLKAKSGGYKEERGDSR
jgi:hypothetical protein